MRDWKSYNQQLINRGEFYINPKFLDNWINEINEMNKGKIGNPYLYPNSEIEFLAVLHCKGYDYRSLEGIITGLSKRLGNFPIISYTQICRRFNSLDIKFEVNEDNLIVAGDGSGEKSTKRGGWMREKWKVKKGWIKVVILGTPNGKIVDIRIGNEALDERASVRGMIRNNHKKIKKFLGDGLHDCKKTFNLCEKYNIETAIKIRKNAQTRSKGSPRRKQEVLFYKSMSHKDWVQKKGYGFRWPASEGIFSADKSIFGEFVSAKKTKNMYHEVKVKFWAYMKLKEAE